MQKKESSLNSLNEFHGLLLKIFRKYPIILNDIFVKMQSSYHGKCNNKVKVIFFQSEYIVILHVLLRITCQESIFNHS